MRIEYRGFSPKENYHTVFFWFFYVATLRWRKLRLFLAASRFAILVWGLRRLQFWSCLVVLHLAGWEDGGFKHTCIVEIWTDFKCLITR